MRGYSGANDQTATGRQAKDGGQRAHRRQEHERLQTHHRGSQDAVQHGTAERLIDTYKKILLAS